MNKKESWIPELIESNFKQKPKFEENRGQNDGGGVFRFPFFFEK